MISRKKIQLLPRMVRTLKEVKKIYCILVVVNRSLAECFKLSAVVDALEFTRQQNKLPRVYKKLRHKMFKIVIALCFQFHVQISRETLVSEYFICLRKLFAKTVVLHPSNFVRHSQTIVSVFELLFEVFLEDSDTSPSFFSASSWSIKKNRDGMYRT